MDCRTTRLLSSDARHGRLAPADLQARQLHLQECQSCSEVERNESMLTRLLTDRLPRRAAPERLRRDLEARWLGGKNEVKTWSVRASWLVPMIATTSLALAMALGYSLGARRGQGGATGAIATVGVEAVNDHLRMLEGESPLQVLTSDLHQVKPWFAGKLDFAPPLTFKGDADYPLLGGQVARFLERRVACFVFARRLHKLSLFVLPKQGLTEVADGTKSLGQLSSTPKQSFASRGFSVVGWERGEFAYLLVSDVNPAEMIELARRIQSSP